MIDLDELERLEKAAMPGPWQWLTLKWQAGPDVHYEWRPLSEREPYDEQILTKANVGDRHIIGDKHVLSAYSSGYGGECNVDVTETDAALIATTRNMLPALIAELRALRKVGDRAYELMQRDVHGVGRAPGAICDDLMNDLAAWRALETK